MQPTNLYVAEKEQQQKPYNNRRVCWSRWSMVVRRRFTVCNKTILFVCVMCVCMTTNECTPLTEPIRPLFFQFVCMCARTHSSSLRKFLRNPRKTHTHIQIVTKDAHIHRTLTSPPFKWFSLAGTLCYDIFPVLLFVCVRYAYYKLAAEFIKTSTRAHQAPPTGAR